jgi:hypothetical protein
VPFTIVVNPAPAVTVTSSASSVCSGGTVTLTASPDLSSSGYTYAWTGAAVSGASDVSKTATVTANPSTYIVTVAQTSTGCTASSSVSVSLKAGSSITVPTPAAICSGDRAVLTASGGLRIPGPYKVEVQLHLHYPRQQELPYMPTPLAPPLTR